jgi:hypothetical protein
MGLAKNCEDFKRLHTLELSVDDAYGLSLFNYSLITCYKYLLFI